MKSGGKREPLSSIGNINGKRSAVDNSEQLKAVKRERLSRNRVQDDETESTQEVQQDQMNRRVLRSKYLAVKTQINDEKDDLTRFDSDKFSAIFNEVENLHQQVQKPREQVADAEALFDIAYSLVTYVKSQSSEQVITPSDFVTSLIAGYGESNCVTASTEEGQILIHWKDIGLAVSPIFRKCYGCSTMLGPMNTELKQRKISVHRKRTRPSEHTLPEELDDSGTEEKTDTDKNMATMFEILRRKKRVMLECLILNRISFAQTVENLFALSFLVKDGRAEITVDQNGVHRVSPRNAPAANSVASGEVTYNHFVFRLDFKDWKLMMNAVSTGEELMPHREQSHTYDTSQAVQGAQNSQATTPIRKLSRNRGLLTQEEYVVADSPEHSDDDSRKGAVRKCKQNLH